MKFIRNWFSNFEPYEIPMNYQGLIFKTNENFFQACKCNKEDIETRKSISLMSPAEAKKAGKKVNLRKDWESVKLNVMRYGLQYKFAKGTTWRIHLDETIEEIVEVNNWHDNFWGNCICEKCKNIPGKNWLGKLLTEIRG